jgi:hypothetical protein
MRAWPDKPRQDDEPAMSEFDVMLRGGWIVDGSGGSPYMADIGVLDGRIAAIGTLDSAIASIDLDVRRRPGRVFPHRGGRGRIPGETGHGTTPRSRDGTAGERGEVSQVVEIDVVAALPAS